MPEVGLSTRLKVVIRGAVQGVGFRPVIHRLATEAGLHGWVSNSSQGVFLEVEGARPALETFLLHLESEKPPRSFIQSLEPSWLEPVGYADFEIRPSEPGGAKTALVLPDIATCPDCLREIFDPYDRRYGYPFTNCTNCGPRFSIVEALPYDRANTSMRAFKMCPQCRAEYDEPRDRRFHAQPNACPACGPRLELWDRAGQALPQGPHPHRAAISAAAEAVRRGQIVAVKGLGGFHLVVAAHNDDAVRRLRELKHREEKPLALMFPSLEAIKKACEVSPLEERLLRSPEAPIVLLRRRQPIRSDRPLALAIAPGNPNLGVMLPYTPLHHLLLFALRFPIVATSGNISDEPICTDEHEALERLGSIADLFLVHNRPIVRHVDDSIARVIMGGEQLLRRARGYAPLPIEVRSAAGNTTVAVGAHLKSAIALSVGPQVFISQHIGDLETDQASEAFRRVIADFQRLYEASPSIVAADAHPDYPSTRFARDLAFRGNRPKDPLTSPPQPGLVGRRLFTVQHHIAHVLSCMAENELEPPLLGVSWDGTGYGLDDTVWGGEFFLVTQTSCERVAYFRPFPLPGGDQAVKEPRRTALSLLHEIFGAAAFNMTALPTLQAFPPEELGPLKTMLVRRLNSPLTSSAGRLFDAVASLTGLRQHVRFEGQAAMELEFALETAEPTNDAYDFPLQAEQASSGAQNGSLILDWSPMLEALVADLKRGLSAPRISARFHNALVEAIIAVARKVDQPSVVLSGGCFQNRYLTERSVQRLGEAGFRPCWHQRVPPNDGGIALGQVIAAARRTR